MIRKCITIEGRTEPYTPIIGTISIVIKNVEENTIVREITSKIISKDLEKIKLYNNIKKEAPK